MSMKTDFDVDPDDFADAKHECIEDGCTKKTFSRIAMEFHILREHC